MTNAFPHFVSTSWSSWPNGKASFSCLSKGISKFRGSSEDVNPASGTAVLHGIYPQKRGASIRETVKQHVTKDQFIYHVVLAWILQPTKNFNNDDCMMYECDNFWRICVKNRRGLLAKWEVCWGVHVGSKWRSTSVDVSQQVEAAKCITQQSTKGSWWLRKTLD